MIIFRPFFTEGGQEILTRSDDFAPDQDYSPSDIVRQLLVDLGHVAVGIEEAWSGFVGFLPASPDSALCFYDTAGVLNGRLMKTGEQIEHRGIQITVRGASYTETWWKAESIARALDAVKGSSVAMDSESIYILHNVSRSGAILPVGVEEEGDRRRHLFTVNATVTVTKEQ
jgi:hypothetical protein